MPIDKLIRDAYGVVARPDRLLKLLSLLQTPSSASEENDMEVLQEHFSRVADLLDEIDPSIGDDFSGFTANEETTDAPSTDCNSELVLDEQLRTIAISPSLSQQWQTNIGAPIPDWAWAIDRRAASKLKNAIKDGEDIKPLMVRLCHDRDDDHGTLYIATIHNSPTKQAKLQTIQLRWDEPSGELFAEILRLTDTEKQLVKSIVDRLSLRQIAQARNRSLGTVRNQFKTLLRKLGISSQLDILSLYSGFHASFTALQFQESQASGDDTSRVFTTSDGASLPYELYGKPGGTPLLYLHATADGAFLTPRQITALHANGFRVIAPWLPFYAGSSVPKMGLPAVEIYADRVLQLLRHLKVAHCPIITVRVSAPYGFALLKKSPETFDGLITAGAIIPIRSTGDFAHLALGYRAPMRLSRIAPGFVKLFFAAAAAMVRKGEGSSFFNSIYEKSPADRAAIEDPEVIHTMRNALKCTFQDGYNAPLQQTLISASDWSPYCEGLSKPVIMICGAEDGLAPAEKQIALCETYGFEMIGPLHNIGSLVIHEIPRLVFDTARKLCDSSASSNRDNTGE